MSTLRDCPNDALARICHYSEGYDILALIYGGDRPLMTKLLATLSDMHFRPGVLQDFPFLAFDMPQLKRFSVRNSNISQDHPITLRNRHLLPSKPCLKLEKLKFSFAQSLLFLSSACELSQLFPSLTSLHLIGFTDELEERHLKSLPKTLIDLALATAVWDSCPKFNYRILEELPNLESFELQNVMLVPDQPEIRYKEIKWPSQLSLLISGFTFDVLHHLPSTLTVANLSLSLGQDNLETPFKLSQLPQRLTRFALSIEGFFRRELLVFDSPMPPKMETWSCGGIRYSSSYRPVPSPMLKYFDGVYSLLADSNLAETLPNLTALRSPNISPHHLLHLPPNLTDLSLSSVRGSEIPWTSIPRTLLQLRFTLDSSGIFEQLPRGLLRLNCGRSTSCILEPLEFANLPPRLEEITLALLHMRRLSCLGSMPRSLTSLTLSDKTLPYDADEADDDDDEQETPSIRQERDMGRFLPPGLTSLSFFFNSDKVPWMRWANSLSHLHQLEKLHIEIGSRENDTSKAPDYLLNLPKNLVQLTATVGTSTLPEQHLWHLPSGLKTLKLFPVLKGFHEMPITNKNLCKLPKGLTRLVLSSGFAGLSKELIPMLPPKIKFLNIPSLEEEDITEYYKHPRWEGYGPE